MLTRHNHSVGTLSSSQKFLWQELVNAVLQQEFKYPDLKVAYLAQCILESGRGTSRLFKEAGNPTGIKWRQEMEGVANPLLLKTPTEPQGVSWCSWNTPEEAINGYWRFIARDRYQGWEAFGTDPALYIEHLVRCGYATDLVYINKVISLFPEAEVLLNNAAQLQPETELLHELEVATWFKVDLSPDGEYGRPVIYAMAHSKDISSLRSTSKQELYDFLLKHNQARTIRLSDKIKVIENETLQRIQLSTDTQATWFQFWRSEDEQTVLLAMNGGYPSNVLVSNNKTAVLNFLRTHPNARTVQGANLVSPPIVMAPPSVRTHHPGGSGSQDAELRPPSIEWVSGSRNFSSRNGQAIDSIILHYTTSRNVHGSIAWFKNSDSKVSAHYIVDRDGKIYQIVKDNDKAWHCYGFNTTSLGIEHVAAPGDKLTSQQEQSSAALIRWLSSEYKISVKRIFGHSWNPAHPGRTRCPGDLWTSPENLRIWLDQKVFAGAVPPERNIMIDSTHAPAIESAPVPVVVGNLVPDSPFSLRVTPHIKYGEICKFEERRRFLNQDQCKVAVILCQFLEKVRTHFGDRALIITSGHRPPNVNREQRGVPDSEHLYQNGKGAIDFYIEGENIYRVQDYCLQNWAHSVGRGAPKGFVHLGYGRGRVQWDY